MKSRNIWHTSVKDQYALIHDAVLETMICGDTQIQPQNIRRAINRLSKKNIGQSGFENQLKVSLIACV